MQIIALAQVVAMGRARDDRLAPTGDSGRRSAQTDESRYLLDEHSIERTSGLLTACNWSNTPCRSTPTASPTIAGQLTRLSLLGPQLGCAQGHALFRAAALGRSRALEQLRQGEVTCTARTGFGGRPPAAARLFARGGRLTHAALPVRSRASAASTSVRKRCDPSSRSRASRGTVSSSCASRVAMRT